MSDEIVTTTEEQGAEQKASIPKTADGKYILKVKGQEVQLSEEELYQKASLAHGAHQLMEQAAQTRKEADSQRARLADVLARVDDGDADAYAELLDIRGVGKEEKAARMRRYYEVLNEAGGGEEEVEEEVKPTVSKTSNRGTQMELPPKLLRAMELAEALGDEYTPDRVKFLLDKQKESYFESERNKVFKDLDSVLESDGVVGKILSKGGSRAEIVRGLAKEKLVGRLRTQQYSPEVRASVLDEVRTIAKEFGIGGGSTSLPGLGASPGVSFTETQATKPPERKSTDDPDYDQNVLARMAWALKNDE